MSLFAIVCQRCRDPVGTDIGVPWIPNVCGSHPERRAGSPSLQAQLPVAWSRPLQCRRRWLQKSIWSRFRHRRTGECLPFSILFSFHLAFIFVIFFFISIFFLSCFLFHPVLSREKQLVRMLACRRGLGNCVKKILTATDEPTGRSWVTPTVSGELVTSRPPPQDCPIQVSQTGCCCCMCSIWVETLSMNLPKPMMCEVTDVVNSK